MLRRLRPCSDQLKPTLPVIENTWFVKHGTLDLAPEALHLDSLEAIRTNRHEDAIRPAFEIAHIEYGRADHATVGGRQVIFEINTNPMIRARGSKAAPAPVAEGAALVRGNIAALLWSGDSGDGRLVRFPRSERLERFREQNSPWRRLFSRFGL